MEKETKKQQGHAKKLATLKERYGENYMSVLIKKRWDKYRELKTTN